MERSFKNIPLRRLLWGVVALLTLLIMVIWDSAWWLLALPLLIDFYYTRFIDWDWYKKLKNKKLRTAMTWVNDIIFCLIAFYILTVYVFQNFVIPTSSLEKTMLVGDYVVVSKLSFGPRTPNTPLAFPLAHNTMPKWLGGGKSYSDVPHWGYRRLKGFGQVKSHDLVVFNFPAGDTVCTLMPNPDYYTLCKMVGGKSIIEAQPEKFGKIVYRPVDRRDHYVKRCIGMPGDVLQIKNNQVFINGKPDSNPKHLQFNYWVQTTQMLNPDYLKEIGISNDDVSGIDPTAVTEEAERLGLQKISPDSYGYVYHFPLTNEMKQELSHNSAVKRITIERDNTTGYMYPIDYPTNWTRDNYGPIYIPKRGSTIELTPFNVAVYDRCIKNYEGHSLQIKDGKVYIDGKETKKYTFGMNYYFMMGDNRHNSADSRYWGFVPEDHIVGKPVFVWMSLDKDKGLFSGKIRWSRLFRTVSTLDNGK
ncbi:signal peptidase I [Falsiporphyromonas endometrii]|uniref:Signal peptidase I n=1 Tax=Falsiporphyromonas endometrii TaxID=1387297 RepID=A0ABV9K596_9PORP